jgi:hypothetical protein
MKAAVTPAWAICLTQSPVIGSKVNLPAISLGTFISKGIGSKENFVVLKIQAVNRKANERIDNLSRFLILKIKL